MLNELLNRIFKSFERILRTFSEKFKPDFLRDHRKWPRTGRALGPKLEFSESDRKLRKTSEKTSIVM